MEITKIKRNNCEVNVIFTGKQYIFHNQFYGLLAVADRKGYDEDDARTFVVRYGNHQTIGGSFGGRYCLSMAKQFIKQSENRYVKTDVQFEAVQEDLDVEYFIECKTVRR